ECDLDVQLLPGKLRRVLLGTNSNGFAVDDQVVPFDRDGSRKPSLDAVIFEKHRQCLGITQVVDGHDFELFGTSSQSAECNPTDTSKTIDSNANSSHFPAPSTRCENYENSGIWQDFHFGKG